MWKLAILTVGVLLVSTIVCQVWRSATVGDAELKAAHANMDNAIENLRNPVPGGPEEVEADIAFPAKHPFLTSFGVTGGFFVIGLLVVIAHNTGQIRRIEAEHRHRPYA